MSAHALSLYIFMRYKTETYILKWYVNERLIGTNMYQSSTIVQEAIDGIDAHQIANGLKRTGYSKVRIDQKHITSITLRYNKA